MAAPDLKTLFQFEKVFEDAAVTFLETDVGIECFAQATTDDFVTPRLDIEFLSLGAEEPVDDPITSTPSLLNGEYRKYDAQFEVKVVTDPTAGQTRANHFEYVGLTRVSLLRSSTNWDATSLPYYGLKYIRQQNTGREVDGDFQITTLTYEIKFSIRDDAFPS